MRFIKKRIALWHIVLVIGFAAIAIPVAARVSSGRVAAVDDGPVFPEQRSGLVIDLAAKNRSDKNYSRAGKNRGDREPGTVTSGGKLPQDYYDRRREYWEKRVERRLEESDEFDDEEDSKDSKDSKDKKDSKADKDDDEDDEVDKEVQDREELYERRRERWRQTLDEDW